MLSAAAALLACGSRPEEVAVSAPWQASKFLPAVQVVPDQYVVLFRDSAVAAKDVDVHARDLAQRNHATVLGTWRHSVRGFAARMTPAQVQVLANDPRVALVEADAEIHLDVTQAGATWGLDRIDQRTLPLDVSYTYDVDGTGVSAYIIDTGIRTTHTEFGGRAAGAFTAVNDGNGTDDCNGHGTHVAGTVGGATYGVAKNVRLLAVRVLDCTGSGTVSGVLSGIDWVTGNHASPAVANMSLGGSPSAALDAAVQRSIDSGVTYAVAAGNSGADACTQSPGSVAPAITVGASDATDVRAPFSNFGPCVDLFAPGVGITSAWATGDTATNTISGTSMATPHVTGAAALYLSSNPTATPADVASALLANATPGVLGDIGLGSPDALLFEGFITAVPTDTTPPAVEMTAPAAGANVAGVVTLSATAVDGVGVSKVDFLVDGALVGTDTTAPYSVAWDSTLVVNGTHTLTAVATDLSGNASASTAVSVSVSNFQPTCSTTSELLGNPGFETGAAAPWTATPFVISGSLDPPARTGAFKAWLDGYGSLHTDTLSQTVAIPATACTATLSFWLLIRSAETTTTIAADKLTVTVAPAGQPATTLAIYSNLDRSPAYVERSFDLTPFRGQTVTIGFRGMEDFARQTSFVVDDVSVRVTQ
jgi:Subtilase family/Bacterial Ig domain/Peptidase inhibitor I9